MTQEQQIELRAMPMFQRIKKYLPLLTKGTITREQYDRIVRLPFNGQKTFSEQPSTIELFKDVTLSVTDIPHVDN